MNIWECTFAVKSESIASEPLTQLVSAASLRKASIKAEAWAKEQETDNSLVLVSLTRRDDVVI